MSVVAGLSRLAEQGYTVVLSVHQASPQVGGNTCPCFGGCLSSRASFDLPDQPNFSFVAHYTTLSAFAPPLPQMERSFDSLLMLAGGELVCAGPYAHVAACIQEAQLE